MAKVVPVCFVQDSVRELGHRHGRRAGGGCQGNGSRVFGVGADKIVGGVAVRVFRQAESRAGRGGVFEAVLALPVEEQEIAGAEHAVLLGIVDGKGQVGQVVVNPFVVEVRQGSGTVPVNGQLFFLDRFGDKPLGKEVFIPDLVDPVLRHGYFQRGARGQDRIAFSLAGIGFPALCPFVDSLDSAP